MVGQPLDAKELTQEVLIKAITHPSAFQGNRRIRTWLYRIAVIHVLNMKRRGEQTQQLSFAMYGAALDNTPDIDLPDQSSLPVVVPLMVEEAKKAMPTVVRPEIQNWRADVATKYTYTCEPFKLEQQGDAPVVHCRLEWSFPGSPTNLRFYFHLVGDFARRVYDSSQPI